MNALRGHLFQPAVEDVLLHLEIGNAVAQEPADAVGFLEKLHRMPGAIQLLRGRKPRRTGAHHRDSLARARLGNFRLDPAFFPGVLDDRFFDHLDRHRRLVDAQHASRLAGRRADAPGELRKIIRGVQHANRFLPLVAIRQVVPVRNNVVHRAAGVAEGNAAIHAARRLRAHLLFRKRLIDLEIVVDALLDGTPRRQLSRVFLEAGDLTHGSPSPARPAAFRSGRAAIRKELAVFPARACIRAETP